MSNWAIYILFLGGFKKRGKFVTEYYFHFNTSRQALDTHKKNVGKKDISQVLPKVYLQINRSYSPTIFFVRSKTTTSLKGCS